MKKLNILSLVFILLILSVVTIRAQEFPKDDWTFNKHPEQNGWNIKKLKEYRKYIIDSTKITGLVIVQNGQIIFNYGDIKENSYIASCRKSVLSMLYGKYVLNGEIDLNKTVANLGLDDVGGLLPIEKKATIKDIISARSGVYHKEGYPGGMQEYAPKRGSVKPGSYWLYSNWDFNVAGYIFEQETGKNIYDEVQNQLAIPLQMQDWDRSLQHKDGNLAISKYLAYPMWFSTRDMARLGLLMLYKGKWGNKQIIAPQWVEEMLKQRTTPKELNKNVPVFHDSGANYGYGYMWWLWKNNKEPKLKGAYSAKGAMGQNITVFPAMNTVLAFKTKSDYRRRNDSQVRINLVKKITELYNVKFE
jgi:CubicO group peptidase (beta-lactamase class C family)